MDITQVQSQLKEVRKLLFKTSTTLEDFLNETTISNLNLDSDEDRAYTKLIFSNLRKLVVHSEEGYEICTILLQREPFHLEAAEKALYKIYHQCIEGFFSPSNDSWFEDSRAAYTGRNSIRFYRNVSECIAQLIVGLEREFQKNREELEYYHTEYRAKMVQSI